MRRPKGTGSYRKLPSGAWEVRIGAGKDLVGGNFRQLRRTVHGSERAAKQALAELVKEADQGRRRASRASVAHLLDRYMEHMVTQSRSPNTIRNYRSSIDTRIKPALGHVTLADLDSSMLDKFYADLKKVPLEVATIRKQHAILAAALNLAVEWGWMGDQRNPATTAHPPRPKDPNPQSPTADQVVALVRAAEARNPTLATFLFMAATTGARRSELLALRWSDFDADLGNVTISRSVWQADGGWGIKTTKTEKVRRLSLDVATVDALERLAARQVSVPLDLVSDAYVFAAELDGSRPYMPGSASNFFRLVRKDLGLGHVKLHHLRSFMATTAIASGRSIKQVSGRLGHANAAMTLNVYSRFMPTADQDIADLVGALLAPPREGGNQG